MECKNLDNIEFKTVFEGELSNTEDILQCTLLTFNSVYEEDPYLEHFNDVEEESIDEFLI